MLDLHLFRTHKTLNALQSLLLLAAMALLFGLLGWRVIGPSGVFMAAIAIAIALFLNPSLSPSLVLRLHRAQPLAYHDAPGLYRMVEILARRAELPVMPRLFYVRDPSLNAFATGSPSNSAIALTDGILRQLPPRELNAVMAHEISHIRNRDIWVMALTAMFGQMTAILSLTGQFLLLLNLPLLLFTDMHIDWFTILLLIFAPILSHMIQLALSRVREYDADLEGAGLSRDPEGLARALIRIERSQESLLQRLLFPGRQLPIPSMLRTHPPTEERIRRLLNLAQREGPWRGAPRSDLPLELFGRPFF